MQLKSKQNIRLKDYIIEYSYLLPSLFLVIITGLKFPFAGDEINFHIPSIILFQRAFPKGEFLISAMSDYKAANGPFPYLIFSFIGNLFDLSYFSMRYVSLAFGLGSLLIYHQLLKSFSSKASGYVFLFASFPYFFLFHSTLLTYSIYLFFLFLGIFSIIKALSFNKNSDNWLVISGFAGCATIITRQTALLIFLITTIYFIYIANTKKQKRPLIIGTLFIVIYILLMLAMYNLWGGLVPPAFQLAHSIELRMDSILLLGISVGVFLSPLILKQFDRAWIFQLVTLFVFLTTIKFLFFSQNVILSDGKGIVIQGIGFIEKYIGSTLFEIMKLVFISIGFVILVNLFEKEKIIGLLKPNQETINTYLVYFVIISSVAGANFTSRLYEVYLISSYPWFYVLSSKYDLSSKYLFSWGSVQLLISIKYFYLKAILSLF